MSLLNSRDDGGPTDSGYSGSAGFGTRGSGILKSIRKSFRRRKRTPQGPPPGPSRGSTGAPIIGGGERPWPDAWLEDEIKVKQGTCQFKVRPQGRRGLRMPPQKHPPMYFDKVLQNSF